MKRFQRLLLTFFLSWAVIGTAGSIDSEANDFAISDFDTVSEAVESIKATLQDQGIEIVGVIDHAANAENVDLQLPATQLILFRDQRLEKRLLRRSPMLAIDLPQKILVWEDSASGEIKLLYNASGYLSDRHGIKTSSPLHRLNQKLKQFGPLDNGLITIDSQFSVEETVENLTMVLQDNDFFIPFTFDFSGKSTNRKPAKLIIFGNPKVGTPLMQNQPAMGLDLPQKFLVWEDHESQVHVTYNNPHFFGKRHGLQGLDAVLGNIANRLGELANEGAGNKLVDQSNLHQSRSSIPIAQADVAVLDPITVYPTYTPVTPTINPVTYVVNHVSGGPTRIPGTHTNSQSNSNTNTINIVNPSVKMSPEEVLKNATDRAQADADRAAKNAKKKADKAQVDADEAKRKADQLKLEAAQAKKELDQMSAPSRKQQRVVDRAQRKADRALDNAKDAQFKADLLDKISDNLKTRAAKGIDKNIIQGFVQAAIDSGKDVGEAFSLGSKLLRHPEMVKNLLDAIGEAKEALQDPARRAEMVKLISEALGEGLVGAIENFSEDKDFNTGYIALSIFDPIGKIGKLGKLSDVARGIERIGVKKVDNPVLSAPRVGSANKADPTHAFPNLVDNFAGDATQFSIPTKGPGGKVVRNSDLFQVEGSLNGKNGVFEWIVDQGQTTHRRFIPNGTVTGFPNQVPKK